MASSGIRQDCKYIQIQEDRQTEDLEITKGKQNTLSKKLRSEWNNMGSEK